MKIITVSKNEAGQRLDKLLSKYLSLAPKSFIYKMLRKKNITLNGKKADGSEKTSIDDEIKIFLSDETFDKFTKVIECDMAKGNIDILYEDEHVLIINKPAGMLSQKAEKTDISMVEEITAYLIKTNKLKRTELISFKPAVCNRLDRNTSGLITAGKTLVGLQQMSLLLKLRTIDKYYMCIVNGRMVDKKKIEGYLTKNEITNKVTIHENEVKDSLIIKTEYEPIKVNDSYTLLKVKLITGRAHQIRAHLASINHPIIGDYKYGDAMVNKKFNTEFKLFHQLLHSYEMVFPELINELSGLSTKSIKAPLPKYFEDIINSLF